VALPAESLSVVREPPSDAARVPPRSSPADEVLLLVRYCPSAVVFLLPLRTSPSAVVLGVLRPARAPPLAEPARAVLEPTGRVGLRAPEPSRGAGRRRGWSSDDVLRALPVPRDPSAAGARLDRRGSSADV